MERPLTFQTSQTVALAVTMALAAPAVLAESHMTDPANEIVVAPAPEPAVSQGDILIIGLLAALAALAKK